MIVWKCLAVCWVITRLNNPCILKYVNCKHNQDKCFHYLKYATLLSKSWTTVCLSLGIVIGFPLKEELYVVLSSFCSFSTYKFVQDHFGLQSFPNKCWKLVLGVNILQECLLEQRVALRTNPQISSTVKLNFQQHLQNQSSFTYGNVDSYMLPICIMSYTRKTFQRQSEMYSYGQQSIHKQGTNIGPGITVVTRFRKCNKEGGKTKGR